MRTMVTGDQDFEADLIRSAREQAEQDRVSSYADLRASGRDIFRLEGNRLICNCHNREVMRFDFDAFGRRH